MSLCPKGFTEEENKIRDVRIKDIGQKVKTFLLGVVRNLCIGDGVTGRGDMAFRIKRLPIIIKAMRDLADELEKEDEPHS